MSTHNKGKTLPPEIYTRGEVERLIKACSHTASSGVRNRALIAVLYRAGLRIAEALGLYLKDVDFDKGTVRVLHAKGDKARTIGIDAAALALLARWVDRRQTIGLNGRHALFSTLRGGPWNSKDIRELLPRLARRAKVLKRVHPHGFRHTFASELLAEGISIGIISKQLGHSSVAQTATYLDHISPQEVVDAVRARKWDGMVPEPESVPDTVAWC